MTESKGRRVGESQLVKHIIYRRYRDGLKQSQK